MTASRTLLLVEDEATAREALTRALERRGFGVSAAASVDEALALAAEHKFFDVVVTDVVLGDRGEGGLDLIDALRRMAIAAPIVVITAFADVAKTKRALNGGAAYLLEKPFRADALVRVIDDLLRNADDVSPFVERALGRVGLTGKELAVARHVLKGLTSEEIATLENNSDKTIRQHISRIYAKCGVSSRAEFFHYVFPV
jgi:DNA-binding NarL/FixJ family response regulator